VTSSLAAQWRLRADTDAARRERAGRVTHGIIGGTLLALAGYVAVESVRTLWNHEASTVSAVGVVV